MKILADANMPFAREAFSALGETVLEDGRAFTAADAADADAVACRSTAKIGPALLEGSRVRFVASGVAGTDHIDIPYLESRGIGWSAAPGCNAASVANWTMSALLALGFRRGTLGIVGFGHVGSQVARYARAAGFDVIVNDPPKGVGADLDTLLAESDAVTLHVSLERGGRWPTAGLFGESAFARMKRGCVFLNAARGAVVDTGAFIAARKSGRIAAAAIDCWEGEPRVRPDAVAAADIATPHIAGYSFDGRLNGTIAAYRALCGFAGAEPRLDFAPPPVPPDFRYDILADDRAFRADVSQFDALRKNYPQGRREWTPAQFAAAFRA